MGTHKSNIRQSPRTDASITTHTPFDHSGTPEARMRNLRVRALQIEADPEYCRQEGWFGGTN